MGASACSRPFVVAEMAIQSKKLIERRAAEYIKIEKTDHPVNEGNDIHQNTCDFSTLQNTNGDLQHGEKGLYCSRTAYTYSL